MAQTKKNTQDNKAPSFEEMMARIEEIVGCLEKGDKGLDEEMELFREAKDLLSRCNQTLEKAELEFIQVQKENRTEGQDET
ncbi:MAG: exodeoxyribonuclease VII small subunit [Clostridia bacterium]|nr:exodeoxyribonuclease VII small subunit [Clostridia bacterium]